jgi:hypothetical protein
MCHLLTKKESKKSLINVQIPCREKNTFEHMFNSLHKQVGFFKKKLTSRLNFTIKH